MKKYFALVLVLIFTLIIFAQVDKTTEKKVEEAVKVEKVEKIKKVEPKKKIIIDSTADHTKFAVLQQEFDQPEDVTKACLTCHTEAAKAIMKTSHWTWSRKTDKMPGKEGQMIEVGKKNVINNFCIGITSNEPRCTSCHIGYGWKDKNFDFTDETKVDCLVCHEQTGTYKKFPTGAGYPVGADYKKLAGKDKIKFKANKKFYYKPDYNKVAQSVARPTNKNCGTCHFFGGGGNAVKHGALDKSLTKPKKEIDVHMGVDGANMQCVDCHVAEKHDIKGQLYSVSVENKDRISCERCHTNNPHTENLFVEKFDKRYNHKLLERKAPKSTFVNRVLDKHTKKIACEACHISHFSTTYKTKIWWDWSKAGDKKRGKKGVEKDEEGNKTYHFKKGEFKLAKNIVPEYYWFDGKVGHIREGDKIDPTKQPIEINTISGACGDKKAKIWPFKVMRGKQLYDAGNNLMIVPKLFGKKGTGAYWGDFDWNKSAAAGMKAANLPFSGKLGWVETKMYWPITHMVRDKTKSLSCDECHSRNGRLAGLEACWIPGRDFHKTFDILGLFMIIGAFFGIAVHGLLRIIAYKKNGGKNCKEKGVK